MTGKKILFLSRSSMLLNPGGDTIQILKTAEYLRKQGYHIDISTELQPDLVKYDFVHLFNLMQPNELYLQSLNAKRYRKKIILSTIYCPLIEWDKIEIGEIKNIKEGIRAILIKLLRPPRFLYLMILVRTILKLDFNKINLAVLTKGIPTLQTRILKMADILLPNSLSELKQVKRDFPCAKGKICVVVPNAVDVHLFNPGNTVISSDAEKYKGCILCVARIDRVKSQLNLVRATRNMPRPLVLIGSHGLNDEHYFEQIKSEAGPKVIFLGSIKHELLPQYYKVAKVHALISWAETTGLSSLEAAAMGCNIVITKKGYTQDYFGDYAFYCDPDSIESIEDAITRAYETPVNPKLRELVLNNYSWEKAAEETIISYRQL